MGRSLHVCLSLIAFFILGMFSASSASTACMRFVEIVTLPQIAAMGQAGVGMSSAPWAPVNPAHVLNTQGSIITFSHTEWFSDISLEALTLSTSSGKHGFGLGVVGLHTEPLEKYDAFDTYEGSFRFFDVAVGASYARWLGGGFGVGATGKVLYEKIDWDAATGLAADLGIAYRAPADLFGGQLGLGIAARNLGGKVGYHGEEFDLPSAFQAGVAYEPQWLPPYLGLALAVDYQTTHLGEDGVLAGVELTFGDIIALRLGYRGAYDNETSFGIGMKLASVSFDYAYMELGQDLGNTHRLAIGFVTGALFPSPEESR